MCTDICLISIVYDSHIGSLRRFDDNNKRNLCAIHLENIPNYLSDNLSLVDFSIKSVKILGCYQGLNYYGLLMSVLVTL